MNKKSQAKNSEKREFSYEKQSEDRRQLGKILKVPGEHNVYNALAALTAARALKISDKVSFGVLSEYEGAWRRMETIGRIGDTVIISDYAHHPTEIKASVEALISKFQAICHCERNPALSEERAGRSEAISRERSDPRADCRYRSFHEIAASLDSPVPPQAGRGSSEFLKIKDFGNFGTRNDTCSLVVIFQPHQQARLEKLFDDFVKVFGEADKNCKSSVVGCKVVSCNFVITDVYDVAGREEKSKLHTKNSKLLVEAIKKKYLEANVVYTPFKKLRNYLHRQFKIQNSKFKILVFMGAGDIDALARKLVVKP